MHDAPLHDAPLQHALFAMTQESDGYPPTPLKQPCQPKLGALSLLWLVSLHVGGWLVVQRLRPVTDLSSADMAQYYHAVFTFLGAIWGANLIALWIGASQPTSLLKICIATLSVISCCLMVATLQQKHWQRELMVLGIQLVIAIPLLFLLRVPSWRTEAEPPMLRPQFSIRSLLVLMIALGVWFTVLSQYHKQMVDVTKWLIAGAIITTTGIITSHQLIRPWNWFRPVVMLGANLFLLSVLLFLSRTDASALNLSLHSTFVVAFFVTVLISTAVGRIANASPKP